MCVHQSNVLPRVMSGLHSVQITALFVNVKIKAALFARHQNNLKTVNAKLKNKLVLLSEINWIMYYVLILFTYYFLWGEGGCR